MQILKVKNGRNFSFRANSEPTGEKQKIREI